MKGYTKAEQKMRPFPKDYTSEGQFAVLVKPLATRHILAYTRQHGCSPDQDLRKVFWIWQESAKMFNPSLVEKYGECQLKPELINEDGSIDTVFGKTRGPLEVHITELMVSLLAAHGRVTADRGELNGFDVVPVTVEEVLDVLPHPRVFFTKNKDDGSEYFYTLLSESGLWSAEVVENEMDSLAESKPEDTPKN